MNTPSLSQVLLDAAKKHMRQSQAKPYVLPTGWVIKDAIQEGAKQAMSTKPALVFDFAKTGLWQTNSELCDGVSYRIQIQTDGLFRASWYTPSHGGDVGEFKAFDDAKAACIAHAEANKPKPDRREKLALRLRTIAESCRENQKQFLHSLESQILEILEGLDA